MAEEANDNQTTTAQDGGNKRLPFKTLLMLVAVLLIEGAAISAVFILAGPADVKAEGKLEDPLAAQEAPAEVLVLADKFQNTRRGRAYLYDTEIYIVVATKHREQIEAAIESKKAAITADIATIIRKAEPAHLMEHELATLRRQIQASLDKRLGYQLGDGEPYIQEVLITRCDEYRSDG